MKILIISDSHGRNENVKTVLDRMQGAQDHLIHLGDCQCDPALIQNMAGCPMDIVLGNCDRPVYEYEQPQTKIVELEGHRALLLHGHQLGYHLADEFYLRELARQNDVEIIMYGHTHKPALSYKDGIWIVNPGSVSQPRQDGWQKTYLVMNIEQGRVDFVPVSM